MGCGAFREASSAGHELDVPQQFGVWQVGSLGVVVAFRGTASQEDVIIDANIAPVPLDSARATRGGSRFYPLGIWVWEKRSLDLVCIEQERGKDQDYLVQCLIHRCLCCLTKASLGEQHI